jgi:hypothetical protein
MEDPDIPGGLTACISGMGQEAQCQNHYDQSDCTTWLRQGTTGIGTTGTGKSTGIGTTSTGKTTGIGTTGTGGVPNNAQVCSQKELCAGTSEASSCVWRDVSSGTGTEDGYGKCTY